MKGEPLLYQSGDVAALLLHRLSGCPGDWREFWSGVDGKLVLGEILCLACELRVPVNRG